MVYDSRVGIRSRDVATEDDIEVFVCLVGMRLAVDARLRKIRHGTARARAGRVGSE
jgi:hypothetical protein